MLIPVGTKYSCSLSGWMWKNVVCESCQSEYRYKAVEVVTGVADDFLWVDKSGAKKRAEEQAHNKLERRLARAIEPVPCPNCGWYQKNMTALFKRKRLIWMWCYGPLIAIVVWIIRLWPQSSVWIPDWSPNTLFIASFVGGIFWYVEHNPNAYQKARRS